MVLRRGGFSYGPGEQVAAARHSLQEFLGAIFQSTAQFDGTLHERIVGDEGVGPHGLDQFLFADQPSRVLHQVFESFIDLWAKLDLLAALEQTSLRYVQRELAESGRLADSIPRVLRLPQSGLGMLIFWLFFGVLSLLQALAFASLH